MNIDDIKDAIRNRLIVSCQALPEEPLHSSHIMGKMALAALEGGAAGIRANTPEDIKEIRKNVSLPIIGIVKRTYPDSNVFITPTLREVDELITAKPEIIALDATCRSRPNGLTLESLVQQIKNKYPNQALMADCSTVEEAIYADTLGFDFIGTTLVGYTQESKNDNIEKNDFQIIRDILNRVSHPVIAEGNIDTPQKAKRVIELGCLSVVVGSIITRPQLITKHFTDALKTII